MPSEGVRQPVTNSPTAHTPKKKAEYEQSDFSEQPESVLQINAIGHPRLDTPADVLKLQRTIGNQAVMRYLAQQPNRPVSVIQRHPSHAPEEELERSIQRHPSHAPEEELERNIQRHPGHAPEEELTSLDQMAAAKWSAC